MPTTKLQKKCTHQKCALGLTDRKPANSVELKHFNDYHFTDPVKVECKRTGKSYTIHRSDEHDGMFLCICGDTVMTRSSMPRHFAQFCKRDLSDDDEPPQSPATLTSRPPLPSTLSPTLPQPTNQIVLSDLRSGSPGRPSPFPLHVSRSPSYATQPPEQALSPAYVTSPCDTSNTPIQVLNYNLQHQQAEGSIWQYISDLKVELSVSMARIMDRQSAEEAAMARLMERFSAQEASIAELKEMLGIALGDRENIPPPRSEFVVLLLPLDFSFLALCILTV